MTLCVLYYVEYSLYNVKKLGFFYLGWNYTLSLFVLHFHFFPSMKVLNSTLSMKLQNVEIIFFKDKKKTAMRKVRTCSVHTVFLTTF